MGILYLFGFVGLVMLSLSIWGWIKFVQNSEQFVYAETDEEEVQ